MREIAKMIDHTQLKPQITETQIEELCNEAKEFEFASVCVNPHWVKFCYDRLKNTPVKVCTVIGFPLGATTMETKAYETKQAVENGATEIDMVINIGAMKSKDLELVQSDIEVVVRATEGKALTKVILETALLTDEEKVQACKLAKKAGADFVKTSTGFAKGGATIEDVALLRNTVGTKMGVKASGGISDLGTLQAMIDAGANRIGASSGVELVTVGIGSQGY